MKKGYIYYLKNFTAPKVWNGNRWECLVTDQLIKRAEVIEETGIHLSEWDKPIYKPERFTTLIPQT